MNYKTEIEDIIDCILKWDSENNSYFSTSEYFKVIQRDLKKAIAEQPKTPQPAGWECPRCHQIHSYLKMSCDCPPAAITSTTCGETDPGEQSNRYNTSQAEQPKSAEEILMKHTGKCMSYIESNYISAESIIKAMHEYADQFNPVEHPVCAMSVREFVIQWGQEGMYDKTFEKALLKLIASQPHPIDLPSKEDVTIELIARYSTKAGRGRFIARDGFIDCYNWIVSRCKSRHAVLDKKEVTDEIIERAAKRIDNKWSSCIYIEGWVDGAKAMRDGKIHL